MAREKSTGAVFSPADDVSAEMSASADSNRQSPRMIFFMFRHNARKGGRGDGPGDADVLGSWRRQRRCGKIKTRVISPGCPMLVAPSFS